MKLTAGLVIVLTAALLSGCAGHVHWGGMDYKERAGVVRTDSSCDGAQARDMSDPSSHCFVSRRGPDE